MKERVNHREQAVACLEKALAKINGLPPGVERYEVEAYIKGAWDHVAMSARKRTKEKAVKKAVKKAMPARNQNPREVAILGGEPSL